MKRQVPSIYASSGSSTADLLAGARAVRMDREQIAEMSCSSGVGGDVVPRVVVTQACARGRSDHGFIKRRDADLPPADFGGTHRPLLERSDALAA